MTKKETRAQIKEQLQLYLQDRERAAHDSNTLIERILNSDIWRSSSHILLFSPLYDEINIAPLIDHCTENHHLYLPVVDSDRLQIDYYNSQTTLQCGSFGILEPQGSQILTDLNTIELAIIPAVGYSSSGDRLGRGKGYYDRLLSQIENCHKMGVCYDIQLVEQIPTELHDQPMDSILTPSYSWQRSI